MLFEGYVQAQIHRARFHGDGGIALDLRQIHSLLTPEVQVSSTFFEGYDCAISGDFVVLEVENSTFAQVNGPVILTDTVAPRGWGRIRGNAFHRIGGDAVVQRSSWSASSISSNNFSSIDGAVWCPTPKNCLDTVEDLNAQPWAEDNLALDPRFVDEAAGDYHLRADSPLVDAAQGSWMCC